MYDKQEHIVPSAPAHLIAPSSDSKPKGKKYTKGNNETCSTLPHDFLVLLVEEEKEREDLFRYNTEVTIADQDSKLM